MRPASGLTPKAAKKEISNLTWCVCTLLLLYVVGGAIFSWLERPAELEHLQRNRFLYKQMREMYEFEKCKEEWFSNMEFCQKQQEFSAMLRDFFERGGNEMEDHGKWTFFGSAFFVSTLVTTLGYGNFHPITPGGQLFAVLLGLVGIPLMGYVLSHVGRFVVEVLMPMCPTIETKTRRLVVLCSLMVLLILLGGLLFVGLEDWSFLGACYFSACTLMSVGFGDYLPTHVTSRLVTMVFIMVGLGVAASFIALLQIHVEVRGEHFAKHLNTWYDTVASECGVSPAQSRPQSPAPGALAEPAAGAAR